MKYTTFVEGTIRPQSPNSSDYHELDDDIDESTTDMESSNERGAQNETEMLVIALQHLYAVFLPPPFVVR